MMRLIRTLIQCWNELERSLVILILKELFVFSYFPLLDLHSKFILSTLHCSAGWYWFTRPCTSVIYVVVIKYFGFLVFADTNSMNWIVNYLQNLEGLIFINFKYVVNTSCQRVLNTSLYNWLVDPTEIKFANWEYKWLGLCEQLENKLKLK